MRPVEVSNAAQAGHADGLMRVGHGSDQTGRLRDVSQRQEGLDLLADSTEVRGEP